MAGCALPPALTDLDLHQYLDGDADPDVIAHLKACPHCVRRAEEMRRLQNQLRHQLFRADCPQPEQLSAYQLHLLDAASSAAIEAHLSHCPYCANELADFTALDAETARTYSGASLQLHNRIRVTVAQWIKNISAGATLPGLQMAALRGNITDWNLFLAFNIIDGCTDGKSREPLQWLFRELDGRVDSTFTAADIIG